MIEAAPLVAAVATDPAPLVMAVATDSAPEVTSEKTETAPEVTSEKTETAPDVMSLKTELTVAGSAGYMRERRGRSRVNRVLTLPRFEVRVLDGSSGGSDHGRSRLGQDSRDGEEGERGDGEEAHVIGLRLLGLLSRWSF
jgi:hypothetical protein